MKDKKPLLVPFVTGLLLILASVTVVADDNTTDVHWHAEYIYFGIDSSVPSGWEDDIENAVQDWDELNVVGLERDDMFPNSWVFYLEIPVEYRAGCPVYSTVGCTVRDTGFNPDHIIWSDIYLNDNINFNFTTSGWDCFLNIDYDVETVAIHEFGHLAGALSHSTESDTVMADGYQDCLRSLYDHDVDSMEAQYAGH